MEDFEYYQNILKSMADSMPYVHELMRPIKSITSDNKVLDVLKLFDIYSELLAITIKDNNNAVGIITRNHYLYQMPRSCVNQLFNDSSLQNLLERDSTIFSAMLIADVDDRIDQVVLELLTFDMRVDILPVKNKTGILGIVKLSDLELKLFESQKGIIQRMTQTSARLKDEVETAANLQRHALHTGKIDLLGVRGLITIITSSEIGGDFCDYYTVNNRWLIMLIGDVSGHGVASGTLVSVAKAMVSLLEDEQEKEPYKILAKLNKAIFKTAGQSLLMTMFVLCIDTQIGELHYANAGHQFPYLYHANTKQLTLLEDSVGLPLGKLEIIHYPQATTQINKGDRLFLYTDAIVEEENSQGEYFGYDRLEEVLQKHITDSSEHLRDILLERFSSHIERLDFGDDVTICHLEFYQS